MPDPANRFKLVISFETAGMTIRQSLLPRADEVIRWLPRWQCRLLTGLRRSTAAVDTLGASFRRSVLSTEYPALHTKRRVGAPCRQFFSHDTVCGGLSTSCGVRRTSMRGIMQERDGRVRPLRSSSLPATRRWHHGRRRGTCAHTCPRCVDVPIAEPPSVDQVVVLLFVAPSWLNSWISCSAANLSGTRDIVEQRCSTPG
jgi:hypothetical protein